ncbi:MAG: prolyl oligopeptidase family serine peptidase [Candidatus Latescibacterota bacterium]
MDRLIEIATQDYVSPHPGREGIEILVTEPVSGVTEETGAMLLVHGWGGSGLDYARDAHVYANLFDLVVVRVGFREAGTASRCGEVGSWDVPYDASKLQTVDCLRALGYVLSEYPVNKKRVYGWGGSQGGHIIMLASLWAPNTFAGVVSCCGLSKLTTRSEVESGEYGSDMVQRNKEMGICGFVELVLGPNVAFSDAELDLRNVQKLARLVPDEVAYHLIHGTRDDAADMRHTTVLYTEMVRAGRRPHLHLIEEGEHSLAGAAQDEDTRLKATLKYASMVLDRKRPSDCTDFDARMQVEIPVSGGTYVVDYASGAKTSPTLCFAPDPA